MNTLLQVSQKLVRRGLEQYLAPGSTPLDSATYWGRDVRLRLGEYALRGKLLRGALVPFTFSLFHPDGNPPAACVDAGVAMELLQSFLLIHDDIMDQDEQRRGLPSIHTQYQDMAPPDSADWLSLARQYGISMGICAGDVAAFLAIHLLSQIDADAVLKGKIIERVSREIILVGLAQMQDVHHGYVDTASDDAVLDVYTHKTGRYTFSLPMLIGALIADATETQMERLGRLGEGLGRIFQIRDDRLGLLEDAEATGKPIGSDIRENKKTLYRTMLFDRIPPDHPVRNIFGRRDISVEDVSLVSEVLNEYNVLSDVDALVEKEAAAARNHIDSLDLGEDQRNILTGLLEYNLSRRR